MTILPCVLFSNSNYKSWWQSPLEFDCHLPSWWSGKFERQDVNHLTKMSLVLWWSFIHVVFHNILQIKNVITYPRCRASCIWILLKGATEGWSIFFKSNMLIYPFDWFRGDFYIFTFDVVEVVSWVSCVICSFAIRHFIC